VRSPQNLLGCLLPSQVTCNRYDVCNVKDSSPALLQQHNLLHCHLISFSWHPSAVHQSFSHKESLSCKFDIPPHDLALEIRLVAGATCTCNWRGHVLDPNFKIVCHPGRWHVSCEDKSKDIQGKIYHTQSYGFTLQLISQWGKMLTYQIQKARSS